MPDRSPEVGSDDPIKSSSFAFPLLIASLLLMLTVAWSFYVEFYGLQPWREYQNHFARAYSTYLAKEVKAQKTNEDAVYASPDYKALLAKVDAAEKAAKVQDDQIAKQIALLDEQRAALGDAFKDARGKSLLLRISPPKLPPRKNWKTPKQGRASPGKWIGL